MEFGMISIQLSKIKDVEITLKKEKVDDQYYLQIKESYLRSLQITLTKETLTLLREGIMQEPKIVNNSGG